VEWSHKQKSSCDNMILVMLSGNIYEQHVDKITIYTVDWTVFIWT